MPVYMIQAGEAGPVKIGWAKKPSERLRELQTGNSERLRVLRLLEGKRQHEARLHSYFQSSRLNGEWFAFSAEMLADDLMQKAEQAGTTHPSGFADSLLISPEQSRIARAALGIPIREFAAASGVSTNSITRFERGETMRPSTINALRLFLESGGMEFIAGDADGGEGVRIRGGPGVRLKRKPGRPRKKPETEARGAA